MGKPSPEGTIYLLHFSRPYHHAKHYLGWTENIATRLAAHQRGNGAVLMAVIKKAGIAFIVARTWQGTRKRERQLKRQGGHSRLCPICKSATKSP